MLPRQPQLERWSAARCIPIRDVAARYGIKLRKGSNRCPFPDHDDNEPSFLFNEHRNNFKCFGCGRSGSSIDFMSALSGLTLAQSVDRLLGTYNQSERVART